MDIMIKLVCVLNIYSRPSRFQYPLSAENDVIRDESPFKSL